MKGPERFRMPSAANENREPFDKLAKSLVDLGGVIDAEMIASVERNEEPNYPTDTPEGIRKEYLHRLLYELLIATENSSIGEEEYQNILFNIRLRNGSAITED